MIARASLVHMSGCVCLLPDGAFALRPLALMLMRLSFLSSTGSRAQILDRVFVTPGLCWRGPAHVAMLLPCPCGS